MMLLTLKAGVKSIKRWISQCPLGISNDSNSKEFEADEILSSRQINSIQDICKWQPVQLSKRSLHRTVINYWKASKGKVSCPWYTYGLGSNFSHTWYLILTVLKISFLFGNPPGSTGCIQRYKLSSHRHTRTQTHWAGV